MTGHTWIEQAAPYALGALDDAERQAFESHLATCDICTAEVRELKSVASLLASAAPRVEPPSTLRDRILADARTVRPMSIAQRPSARSSPVVASAPDMPAPASGRVRPSIVPWLAAAAAIVFAVYFADRFRGERDARVAAERSLASARVTIDSTGTMLASRDSLIATLVAPEVQAVTVSGSGPSPQAKYFFDRRAGRIVIAASSLPPAARGRTYQLWGIETGRPPVSLGTFDADSNVRAIASVSVPPGLRIAVTAVTDEPRGGSPQPTTTPFLAATWKGE